MEFLFTDKWASVEALLVLICLLSIGLIYAYDGYVFLKKFFDVFVKKKDVDSSTEVSSPEITPQIDSAKANIADEQDEWKAEIKWELAPEGEREIEPEWETETHKQESALYEEYVAIVEATHTEKENKESSLHHSEEVTDLIEHEVLEKIEMSPDIQIETKEEVSPEDTVTSSVDIHIPEIKEGVIKDDEQTDEINTKIENTPQIEEPTIPSATPKNNNETVFALINTIKTLIARGQTHEARTLIIQWLALDKSHRELNLLLGTLYEAERHFEKAEYVYKDLATDYSDNIEILEKLGNVLIIQKRYSIAFEIYKKILTLGGENEGTLYILSHLCHELGNASDGHMYMKKYLKQWPNNPEVLSLMSEAELELWKRKDAIETLKRLKNLTPYNGEITETLQKLMMEEELAGNFGEK